jgi:hypothetical protein
MEKPIFPVEGLKVQAENGTVGLEVREGGEGLEKFDFYSPDVGGGEHAVLGNHILIDFHWLNTHDASYRPLQGHGVVSTNRLEEGMAELGWRLQVFWVFGFVLLPTKPLFREPPHPRPRAFFQKGKNVSKRSKAAKVFSRFSRPVPKRYGKAVPENLGLLKRPPQRPHRP